MFRRFNIYVPLARHELACGGRSRADLMRRAECEVEALTKALEEARLGVEMAERELAKAVAWRDELQGVGDVD